MMLVGVDSAPHNRSYRFYFCDESIRINFVACKTLILSELCKIDAPLKGNRLSLTL